MMLSVSLMFNGRPDKRSARGKKRAGPGYNGMCDVEKTKKETVLLCYIKGFLKNQSGKTLNFRKNIGSGVFYTGWEVSIEFILFPDIF